MTAPKVSAQPGPEQHGWVCNPKPFWGGGKGAPKDVQLQVGRVHLQVGGANDTIDLDCHTFNNRTGPQPHVLLSVEAIKLKVGNCRRSDCGGN